MFRFFMAALAAVLLTEMSRAGETSIPASGEPGAVTRIVKNVRRLRQRAMGLWLGSQIHKGMKGEDVTRILGPATATSVGACWQIEDYTDLGLGVFAIFEPDAENRRTFLVDKVTAYPLFP
jgi:hypothetical protein